MDNSPEQPADSAAEPAATAHRAFAEFLESSPPDLLEPVSNLTVNQNGRLYLAAPELKLHCDSDTCNGVRVFFCPSGPAFLSSKFDYYFLTYVCRNCRTKVKTFALAVTNEATRRVQKLGEHPPFGPPVPARVITLVGADRELFLKGRRAELRGLGIGAFAYYRRVVEDKKGRIIEEIGKVAARLGAQKETVQLFEEAKSETQFSAAIDKIKAAIPTSLLIDGHNPLTLLHSALSAGLHEKTDAECLELATSIRLILIELADRISAALKDEAELKDAVSKLLNRKSS